MENAINSVVNQTYKNIEIIVVDDNDSESNYRKKTEKIMLKYKNNYNIKYIKHLENKNGAVARNTGLKFSQGIFSR
ncbi:MAG: glycosyltransferase family A protein [Halanaerobiales bacterium]|nr:glycosyltransferase family A protein [Halanaerobiales bacterium]